MFGTALVEWTGLLMSIGIVLLVVGGVIAAIRWVIVSAIRTWHDEADLNRFIETHEHK